MSSYYGVAEEAAPAVQDVDVMNIDGPCFSVDKYVASLLQYKSLEELVHRGNAMVSEIKSLDSDMQMLVYENYNKFISATDTIRKMKHRVEDMESQMMELEKNMSTISTASESVNSSLSTRRGELEKLNCDKKNLAKLQFVMDLPSRLQMCIREERYELAVQYFRKATSILDAVSGVASFKGIHDEAVIIMRGMGNMLNARLNDPELSPEMLGSTTRLLLHLEGNEELLLQEFLSRRRATLQQLFSSFPNPLPKDEDLSEGLTTEKTEEDVAIVELHPPARDVAQLGEHIMPQLVQLHTSWQQLFVTDAPQAAVLDSAAGSKPSLSAEKKETMLLDTMQELAGGYIDMCRRRLQEEQVDPEQLLQGLRQLMLALQEVHALVPQAKLLQQVTRVAEQLAKRAMDQQLQFLQQQLGEQVAALESAEPPAKGLQELLLATGSAIAAHVQKALAATAPLLVPVCELLKIRADGLAQHLVTRLAISLTEIARAALRTAADASGVVVRAGLCLYMVSTGVTQVPAMLRAQLAPHGLGGTALGFDAPAMVQEMQKAADVLLERFVELQAQKLSLEVSRRMHATEWLQCAAPREVTAMVGVLMEELRKMQSLAAQVLPAEQIRPLLPQGPYPTSASAAQQSSRRHHAGAIQNDLQRMFAKKITFETFSASAGGKATIVSMASHVTKLMLKTLVEEVRLATFNREGFNQVQVDCGMLRWVLPAFVADEGAVLALLDEVVISCQERCLDCVPVEHEVLELLCENKRKDLLLALA